MEQSNDPRLNIATPDAVTEGISPDPGDAPHASTAAGLIAGAFRNGRPLFASVFLAAAVAAGGIYIGRAATPASHTAEPETASSISSRAGEYVVLAPESWIGKSLPLIEHLDIGERLATGKWVVLLHRHDCASCAEALRRLQQEMSDPDFRESTSVAVVDIPPFGPNRHLVSSGSGIIWGRLNDDQRWFVQTPVEFTLKDGVVLNVTSPGEEPD